MRWGRPLVSGMVTMALGAVLAPAGAEPFDLDRQPDGMGVAVPVRTSWAEAVRRDAQHAADVAAGRVPARTGLTEVPWREPDVERQAGVADAIYFVPPIFEGRRSRPEQEAPQTLGVNFIGVDMPGARYWRPPDSNGAIGPNHFVAAVNNAVCIYNRSGTLISNVSLDSLLGGSPVNGAFDPRIVYDRRSGRWFITVLEFASKTNNRGFIAVSNSSDPTGGWYWYALGIGMADTFNDYETLGTDDNGVYMGFTRFGGTNPGAALLAVAKDPVVAGAGITYYYWSSLTDLYSTPQPALNVSAAGAGAKAWIAASSTAANSDVRLKPITWSGTTPTLGSTVTVSTYGYGSPVAANAKGSSTDVSVGDDRIQMSFLRDGQLWVCRNVGVDATGAAGTDRTGSEWIQINTIPATPVRVQSGRVYDPTSPDPRMYYYPSLAVSGQGHVAMGFSGSNGAEYVSAYTAGRLTSDAAGTMRSIITIKDGTHPYTLLVEGVNRWGDYSYTSVDPNDDQTIWTIQEYASATDVWCTWIAQLLAPAPKASDPAASALQFTSGASFTLTGTGFFDPGAGFPNHVSVALTGGLPNGISGVTTTYNSPTSVTVTYNVSATARPGTRSIVLTNPDGQTTTVIGGLTIVAKPASKLSVYDRTGNYTDTIALKANLYRSSDNALLTGRTVTFSIAGTTVGSVATNASGLATLNWTITSGAASRTIGAAYAGGVDYLPCSGTARLTSTVQPTKVYVVDRLNVKIKTYTVLKAYLYTTANAILPGRVLSLSVDGTALNSSATNGSGYISLGYTVPEGAGVGVRVIGSAWAGNEGYSASSNTGKLGVVEGNLYIWPYVRSGKRGTVLPLTAYVRSLPDYVIQPGKEITFKVNGSVIDVVKVGTNGWAAAKWSIPLGERTGAHTCTAEFAGDSWYAAVTASTTFNVVL
ncbi:MAG: hypothetical protein NT029_07600 [Armatimonadetes bacterium]|nr:hypothetical protein [Armatimonadota bacterium]